MASGGQAPNFRFYFHAQPLSGEGRFLVEAIINTAAGSASVTLKSDAAASHVAPFCDLLKGAMDSAH